MFGLGYMASAAIGAFIETPIAMAKDIITCMEDGKSSESSYTKSSLDKVGEDLNKVFDK